MTASSDLELVKRFQQGNESAFNELVLRYQEKIYWLARKFCNDHDSADEIVQEVFCKVYESLKDFRGESGFYTWLYRITVNASLNALRRERLNEFFRIDEFFEQPDRESEPADTMVEREENRALIQQAMKLLPEKQKAVFVLRFYEELPYEQIADLLNTSVGGLKANYFHAVKKIGEFVRRAHESR